MKPSKPKKSKNAKFLEPKKANFKFPDFRVEVDDGRVSGKGGGSNPIRTPKADNDNGNTVPFKRK